MSLKPAQTGTGHISGPENPDDDRASIGAPQTMYLALDIGCIECGEETTVVGLFSTALAAWEALTAWEARDIPKVEQRKAWTGHHGFEVHAVPGGYVPDPREV